MPGVGNRIVVEVAANDDRILIMCFGIVTYAFYLNSTLGIGLGQFDKQQLRLDTDGVTRHLALQYLAILLAVILVQVTALKMVVDHYQRVVIDLQPPGHTAICR